MRDPDHKDEPKQASTEVLTQTDASRRQIREQLKKLLADRLFHSGTRYGSMLQYIVECALEGKPDQLKERVIGFEVFKRDSDYDTNSDPVVRVTASELRKRIAQYYVNPQHAAELHIELPAGSYAPEFRLPQASPGAGRKNFALRLWPLYLVIAALATGSYLWLKPREANTAQDWFWRPVLNSTAEVVICIAPPKSAKASKGEPDQAVTVRDMHEVVVNSVSMADLMAFSKISEYLILHGKRYEIRSERSINLTDLRRRPAVLIGGFNNEWAMRLLRELRFSFETDISERVACIKDRDNTERRWSVDYELPYKDLAEDYAIISRVLDPTTEQLLVSVAGITRIGTIAAGEFLANEANLQTVSQMAPEIWQRKNLQIVLATKVVNGNSGPSRIVASAFW